MEGSPLIQRINERFGLNQPTEFFDPSVISDEELEEDLISIEFEIKEAERKRDSYDDQYEDLLDEAAQAPEYKQDDILREAADVEDEREMWESIWCEKREIRRLIKANRSFRERTSAMSDDLNITDTLQNAEASELKGALQTALSDHMMNQRTVRKLTQAFTDARDVDDKGRSDKDLEKHRKRMEARQRSQSGSAGADSEEDEEDEERAASAD